MRLALGTKEELNTYADSLISRENKGTDRDNKGVGRDMSISLNLLYTETRRPHSVELISHGELSLKKYHIPSFTKSLSSTKLISTLSAILLRSLRTSDRG